MPGAHIPFGPAQHPNPITWKRGGAKHKEVERKQEQQQLVFVFFIIIFLNLLYLNNMQRADKRPGVFLEATIPMLLLQLLTLKGRHDQASNWNFFKWNYVTQVHHHLQKQRTSIH